jgi:hypothetical protein
MRGSTGRGNNPTGLKEPMGGAGSPERSVPLVRCESLIKIFRSTFRAPSQPHSDNPSLQLTPHSVVIGQGSRSVSCRY